MNVYGSQLWCFNNYKSVERFYITWRKTIRRIWPLDKITHNVLINFINRCSPINLILEKRCIKYIWNLFNSSHELHKTIVITIFIIRDLLWQRILDILCISMILLLIIIIIIIIFIRNQSYILVKYDNTINKINLYTDDQ